MVRIPDAASLGARNVPRPSRSIAAGIGDAEARAAINLGQQMQKTSQYVNAAAANIQKEKDKVESANAQLSLMQANARFEEEARKNPSEYEQLGGLYNQAFSSAVENAKKGISDKSQHAQFDLAAKQHYMRGQARVADLTRSFRSDATMAYMAESYDTSKSGVRSLDDVAAISRIRKEQYDGYAKTGVIPADTAMRSYLSERNDMQRGYVDNMVNSGKARELYDEMRSAPLSVRNNSPGNLRGRDGNFLKFPTPEEGLAAMKRDLTVKVSGKSDSMKRNYGDNYVPTIRTLISTYAPSSENDVDAYVGSVVKDTGIPEDIPLGKKDVAKLMKAMIKVEGGKKADVYFSGMSPENRDYAINRAAPVIKADMNEKIANNIVLAKNGLPVEDLTPVDFAIYQNEKVYTEYKRQLTEAETMHTMVNMSVTEISEKVKVPLDQSTQDARSIKEREVYMAAGAAIMRQRNENPSDSAIKADKNIATLSEGASKSPETYPQYFEALDKKYEEWGIDPLENRYLSKAQINGIANEIMTAVEKGGDEPLAKIALLKAQYGEKYFHAIFGDVAPQLGGAAQVAVSIYGQSENEPARRLLGIANIKKEELKGMIATEDATDIRKELSTAFAPLMQTLLSTNEGSGASTGSMIAEQAEKLAYSYVASGMSAGAASEFVVKTLMKEKYHFVDSYRVPKAHDASIVSSGADRFLNKMKSTDITIPKGDQIDPDGYLDSIRANGKWVNNEDETGLVLLDSKGVRVKDAGGNEMNVRFDVLELFASKDAKNMGGRLRQNPLGAI